MFEATRRRVLQAAGGVVASASLAGLASGRRPEREGGWRAVRSPTDATLNGVAPASTGTFAVGEDGVILARGGGRWTLRRSEGISGASRTLHAVAGTDRGGRLWLAGEGGTLAAYDPGRDRVTARPAPSGEGATFTDVAAVGEAGSEVVLASDESGGTHRLDRSRDEGWTHATPGSGSTISALAVHCRHRALAVDTNGCVFERTKAGWQKGGVEDADVNFFGVAMPPSSDPAGRRCGCRGESVTQDGSSGGEKRRTNDSGCGSCSNCGRAVLVGGDGTVRERSDTNEAETSWPRVRRGGAALRATDWDGPRRAVGDDGTVLVRAEGNWERESVPAEASLRDLTTGSPTIAVGENGVILER